MATRSRSLRSRHSREDQDDIATKATPIVLGRRRNKSRSPDAGAHMVPQHSASYHLPENFPSSSSRTSEPNHRIVDRKRLASSVTVPSGRAEDRRTTADHGRRVRTKHSNPTTGRDFLINPATIPQPVLSALTGVNCEPVGAHVKKEKGDKGKEKDGGKSRDTHRATRKAAGDPASRTFVDKDDSKAPETIAGLVANNELSRLRREIDALKQTVHDNKKTIKRQTKLIDDMKKQASTSSKELNEKDLRIKTLTMSSKKNQELISTIEVTLQCQVCMDLLLRPYAISPCGHVLCVSCLQQWFRTAPPAEDDLDVDPDDMDEYYVMTRDKSCPCCRAVVKRRPVPVFIVKSLASAVDKARRGAGVPASLASPALGADDDPWKGIFLPIDEDRDDGDANSYDSDSWGYRLGYALGNVEEDDEGDNPWGAQLFSYGSGSDSDEYLGDYVQPQWEPPDLSSWDPDTYEDSGLTMTNEVMSMLQRGCSPGMIMNYDMEYSHAHGLVAQVPYHDNGGRNDMRRTLLWNKIHLGWNVEVNEDDYDGDDYMEWILADMVDRPERWDITSSTGEELDNVLDSEGPWIATRLVRAEDVIEYNTTDSES